MTQDEAKKITDLCIEVDDLVEDGFYLQLAMAGRISKDAASGAVNRLNKIGRPQKVADAIIRSEKLVKNLDKYGIPCAQWCTK